MERNVRQRTGDAPAAAPPPTKSVKDDGKGLVCGVCGDTLARDHTGIRCNNSHHLCEECSVNFKNSIMSEPQMETFPVKCSFCACQVNGASFERFLNETERSTYLTYLTMSQLPDDEIMLTCPFCPFFETRVLPGGAKSSHAQATFLHCKNGECAKVSCSLCKKECVPCDDDNETDEAKRLGMDDHFVCAEREAELGAFKTAWEEAIEMGIKQPCPSCGHNGVKDDACTHMTCEACNTVWCYVCGLNCASDECSKEPIADMLPCYQHNHNWQSDERRCPMYLTEINQLDPAWPANDREAVDRLLRFRVLRNFKREFDKMGPDAYARMVAAFPGTGAACGYTEEVIQQVDLGAKLFERNPDWAADEGEEEDEGEELRQVQELRQYLTQRHVNANGPGP